MPQGCRFGRLCTRFHDFKGVDTANGQCSNCGSHEHLRAVCSRPGGGKYDEATCPIAKGRSSSAGSTTSTSASVGQQKSVAFEADAAAPAQAAPDTAVEKPKRSRKIKNRSLRVVRRRRQKLKKSSLPVRGDHLCISDSGAESHMRPISNAPSDQKLPLVTCDGADGEFQALTEV